MKAEETRAVQATGVVVKANHQEQIPVFTT
jgi:hypothetical protein